MNYESIRSLIFKFDPETAHRILEKGLCLTQEYMPFILSNIAQKCIVNDDSLKQNLLGLNFNTPIGLAGGFDKNAKMTKALANIGFSFMEIGTFTPLPQEGNAKPRVFRLVEEESIQNAMGFNNEGKDKIASRMASIYPFCIPIAASIGKNKDTPNDRAYEDYFILIKEFKDICDYFVVNISSPNTKNLRDLQSEEFIEHLFSGAKEITNKPFIIKIAPDMEVSLALSICQKAIECGVKGIVIANTSTDYSLINNGRTFGGISGRLIQEKNGIFFKELAKELYSHAVLIASGGIDSAEVAYERIKNGASLIEVYTALIYKGPFLVKQMNERLIQLLKEDGFLNISDAIGANLK